jgi:hypothetical protein
LIGWNLHSGNSDADLRAFQAALTANVHLWGLSEVAREHIIRAIRDRLRGELYGKTDVDSLALLCWLLAGPPDDESDFSYAILDALGPLAEKVAALAGVSNAVRATRYKDLRNFFADHATHFSDALDKLNIVALPAHFLLAAYHLMGWDRIILVYDNVDRIPLRNQDVFRSVVNDIHLGMGGACTSTIAIRGKMSWVKSKSTRAEVMSLFLIRDKSIPRSSCRKLRNPTLKAFSKSGTNTRMPSSIATTLSRALSLSTKNRLTQTPFILASLGDYWKIGSSLLRMTISRLWRPFT